MFGKQKVGWLLSAVFSISIVACLAFADTDTAAKESTSSPPNSEPVATADQKQGGDAEVFPGEIVGRAVVLKKQVEDKEENVVYIIGKVKAEDETKLSVNALAELKRLGRKRLEVCGPHKAALEKLNGKSVSASGKISFSQMTIEVESFKEEKVESPRTVKSGATGGTSNQQEEKK
ncbi:MAG TPA: hypothetical protein PKY35_11930 [Candidatus Hydrogenedentes bacterium]|nr:hypothetical protein [Candidatus Hydrogenedentota bacterium]HOL77727.1 hypothetical protein [Candidatus Hydrogenedentota bacterium]HPO86850.1 hypothetical protein [Candidatus Hydrogenedentota bacterium]